MLLQCTKDESVTSIISKCNNLLKFADTELVKLFTHTEKEKDPEEHAEATGEGRRGNKQHQKRRGSDYKLYRSPVHGLNYIVFVA